MVNIRKIIKETLQLLFEEEKPELNVKFTETSRGSHSGQHDLTSYATLDGIVVGYVDYSIFQSEIHIEMVEVSEEYKRMGIATKLFNFIRLKNSGMNVIPGYSTAEGHEFYSAYKTKWIKEDINVPINIGDTVLGGRFKNKKIVVKDIDKNEKGDITINNKPLLKVRIQKKENEVSEGSVKTAEKVDIYRDNNYIVVRPLTERASCKYGAYTKWCISAPSSGAWDSNPNAIVIMIIQKNYKIDTKREQLIQKFLTFKDKEENGELTPGQKKQFEFLLDNSDIHDFEDLSKIALVFGGNNVEIWDANNIPLNDNYQFGWERLPISIDVKLAIENYVEAIK